MREIFSGWLPVAASAHAGDIDRILVLVHVLMLVLFTGWFTFFVVALVRSRRGRTGAPSDPPRGRAVTWIEGSVVLAEIVLLAFFSIPAWSARVDAFPAESESTVVRVVAEQFVWNVHYPGADATFGRTALDRVASDNPLGLDLRDPAARDDVTTINELHLPVGRPAIVFLSSKDVVHSFGLPEMRVKQDAVPGLVQPVWFTPTRTGAWDITCSQLCGLAHYRMKGRYVIEFAAQYSAWLAQSAAANVIEPVVSP